jgi:hypothetical protein
MKRVFAVLLTLGAFASACQKPAEPEHKAMEPIAPVKEIKEPQPAKTPAEKEAVEAQPEPVAEDLRQKLLEEEYNEYADTVITHSVAELSRQEAKMLRNLLVAAQLIEELHMLQIHPDNLKWRDKITIQGTDIEKKIFLRYQMPWCGDNESTDCVALSDKPEKKIGHVFWPDDFRDAEYEALSRQINSKELLSPFTVVRRKEKGGFEAVPYAQADIFGPRMAQAAKFLRSAAEFAPDPSLKNFLESRADAFESDSAFPYDASDYDWIAVKGDWEVTVGPYETYKDPRQQKALFEMYVGREDKGLTAELARFKDSLQEMENALGGLVGPEIYKSRKLDPRISIRAVDIWMASGDGRRDRGATVAYHLPNRGKSVDEGLYKKVMMVNHSQAFEAVSKARAGLTLNEGQLQYVDNRSDIANTTFHEFSHGFGAYHEMRITNSKGNKTTVKEALKEHETLLEEEKADVLGMWLIQFQKKKGWLDPDQEKKRYVSALMHILGLLQYPLTGVYPRMVAIQLGWYIDCGAVSWDRDKGRFTIDIEKMPEAVESLAKKVATIQLTGDYDQAKELVDKYVAAKGENEYELNGILGQARKVMMDKFKEAGIKSPSLRYEVVGW